MAETCSPHARSIWLSFLAALLGGIVVGALLNLAEASGLPGASDFGNYFGLWIVLVTVIATWSHSWQHAILHAVIFLLAMLTAYYLSTLLLSGYFLAHLLLGWAAVTLVLAPPFAALVWYVREKGWRSALAAALPVGLLLYEAHSLRFVLQIHGVQFAFDVAAAIVLILILPGGQTQRLRMFAFVPFIVLGAMVIHEQVLPILLGLRL